MSEELPDLIKEVVVAPTDDQEKVMSKIIATQEPCDVALLLESLPLNQRLAAWSNIRTQEELIFV